MKNTEQLYNPKVIEQKRAAYRLAEMKQDERRVRTAGIKKQSEISTGLMKKSIESALEESFEEETPDKKVDSWLQSLYTAREKAIADMPKQEPKKELGDIKPRSRDEGGLDPSLDKQAEGLFKDEYFKKNFDNLLKKYPQVSRYELLRIIDGESNFNPAARNKDTNASGLFQFTPTVAGELGFTPEEIRDMPASSQLSLYEKYLDKWGYDGSYSLGILQAAPAKRNVSPNTIIYKKGSAAWEQNPGWRDKKTGHITKASIDAYYRRNK
jgi:hypothetical protein